MDWVGMMDWHRKGGSTRKGRRGKRTPRTPSFQNTLNLFVQWDASSTMEAPSRSQPHLVFGAEITLTFRIPQEDDKVLRSGCGAVELNLRVPESLGSCKCTCLSPDLRLLSKTCWRGPGGPSFFGHDPPCQVKEIVLDHRPVGITFTRTAAWLKDPWDMMQPVMTGAMCLSQRA